MNNLRTYEEWDWSKWPWTGDKTEKPSKLPRSVNPNSDIARRNSQTGIPLHGAGKKDKVFDVLGISDDDYQKFLYNLEKYNVKASLPYYNKDSDYYFITVAPRSLALKYTIKFFKDTDYAIVEYYEKEMGEGGEVKDLKKRKVANINAAYDFVLNRLENEKDVMKKAAREYTQEEPRSEADINREKNASFESVMTFEEYGSGDVPSGCGKCGKKRKEKKQKKMKWSSDVMIESVEEEHELEHDLKLKKEEEKKKKKKKNK